ncbi:holo-acyl-carrier-protein synthase [Anaeromyxobacter sp. K]|uniref:Holo-[acyl-carrier-protein] synthase n=1 Tax=Anaeromyxobacter sp. (strain K) TaxID=447217 RepID=ACPS_ANASK|nr:holo-ACP synthase [Anaeromyxobacter sp. K]B4UEM2.1 RecName: Full=Holo-[acyl-carrier-protein] synthase; Short=Holo-ACP synthase; AltName: Full=4'-phosphopantetheinyl transferase AcpS [Anaeromyxobacter sp. K]ACG73593.1 holo-acyl-carrier-protein synthase [Anaeromyxobacter sp. K]
MILGLGLDVVEVARIQRILAGPPARAERFLARVFAPSERAYCDARQDRATRYAARFAAKEAAVKALGTPEGVRWLDLVVERGSGAPSLALDGLAADAARRLGVARVHLTLTHDAGVAVAAVILEGTGP